MRGKERARGERGREGRAGVGVLHGVDLLYNVGCSSKAFVGRFVRGLCSAKVAASKRFERCQFEASHHSGWALDARHFANFIG